MKRYYHITTDTEARDLLADANITEHKGGIIITRLCVPSQLRKMGYGTQILNEIIHDADEDGIILWANPTSITLPKEKIIAWYEKRGFVYDEKEGLMKREPIHD